jgi:bifunctional ADP-heptose synthase (sugar kinase/adenylyltransferase)
MNATAKTLSTTPDAQALAQSVQSRGGRVIRVDLTQGFSTTELIRRVQAAR